MKLQRIIPTTILLFILMACTEELKVIPFTYPQMFAGEVKKGWSIRSVQLLQSGKGTLTFRLDQCIMDDIYLFYNNPERTYHVGVGATKCDESEPNLIVDSNWSFVNTSATLMMLMPLLANQPLPFILREVDETKMVVDIYFDEGKSNYRFNFKPVSVE